RILESWTDCRLEVESAADLEGTLARLARTPPPDVLLLDLDLPDSRGMETALVVLERAPEVPLVVLADAARQAEAWQATRHGARSVVLRGRTASEIGWALVQAAEQQQMRLSLERHLRELELTNGRFLSLVV